MVASHAGHTLPTTIFTLEMLATLLPFWFRILVSFCRFSRVLRWFTNEYLYQNVAENLLYNFGLYVPSEFLLKKPLKLNLDGEYRATKMSSIHSHQNEREVRRITMTHPREDRVLLNNRLLGLFIVTVYRKWFNTSYGISYSCIPQFVRPQIVRLEKFWWNYSYFRHFLVLRW